MPISQHIAFDEDIPLTDLTRDALGWSPFFMSQLDIDEIETLTPARIATVHRDRVTGFSEIGGLELTLDPEITTAAVAVGDWVLAAVEQHRLVRVLDRKTELSRSTEFHTGDKQLIAANLDTLFITSSCNNDFNVARLERYLALAHDAMVTPVILLTKADQCDDPDDYIDRARALGRGLDVIAVDAKSQDVTAILSPWCGKGQTVALTGSSGVGKTTVANALTGGDAATQDIREDDARGRHTTTGRSLHAIPSGGWLIDTPGMRGLGLAEAAFGIDATFPEISERVPLCKFRDCDHDSEPGCAVQAAIASGDIDPERLRRFKKLQSENTHATETIVQSRARAKKFSKGAKRAMKKKER
jgi:ribosome biogenesis GTPase